MKNPNSPNPHLVVEENHLVVGMGMVDRSLHS